MACADDITLTDGTVFKGAKLISHDDKSVTLSFVDGVAKVKIETVPPILIKAMDTVAPLPPASPAPPAARIDPGVKSVVDQSGIPVVGNIVQVVSGEGVIVDLSTSYTYRVTTPHKSTDTVNTVPAGLGHTPVLQTTTKTWTTIESKTATASVGLGFVECQTDNIKPGQTWASKVWNVGTHSYTVDDGAPQTVPKFTNDPETAYKYYSVHRDLLSNLGAVPSQPPVSPPVDSPVQTKTDVSVQPMNEK